MPTRFWVKNTGNPSSINIARDTKRIRGENSIRRSNAKIRLSNLLNFKIV